ncbi:MAG: hypothetical protein M0P17_02965 [Methanoculleus sp.]|nr:hypothetical protein [Methanoculleus sp.]
MIPAITVPTRCVARERPPVATPAIRWPFGTLKGNSPLRQQFIDLAAYLDDYNNKRLKE